MRDLHDVRVAIIALDGFEESELTEPKEALEEHGARVDVVSEEEGEIQGFHHHNKAGKIKVSRTLKKVNPNEYDAVMLPGGALNADQGRMNPRIRDFVIEMDRGGKPIAAICHAPWILISAGLARGRKLTSWHTIHDDIRNAGAQWVDEEYVLDHNLLTSRGPQDLPAFNREMVALFSQTPAGSHR